jgi:hypothetical protein
LEGGHHWPPFLFQQTILGVKPWLILPRLGGNVAVIEIAKRSYPRRPLTIITLSAGPGAMKLSMAPNVSFAKSRYRRIVDLTANSANARNAAIPTLKIGPFSTSQPRVAPTARYFPKPQQKRAF